MCGCFAVVELLEECGCVLLLDECVDGVVELLDVCGCAMLLYNKCVDVLCFCTTSVWMLIQMETGDPYPQCGASWHHGGSDVPCSVWQEATFLSGS